MTDQPTTPMSPQGAPSPAPPSVPAPTPASDVPTPAGDGSVPPPATEEASPAPAPEAPGADSDRPRIPDDVPYTRFREVQTEATKYRRMAAQMKTELDETRGALRSERERLQQEYEQLNDLRALQEAVRRDPELYSYIEQRLTGESASGQPLTAAQAAQVEASIPKELRERLDKIDAMSSYIEERRQQDAAAQRDAQMERDLQRLGSEVEGLLDRSGAFRKEAYENIKPQAMQWIMQQALREMPDGGGFEHIPHYFNRWLQHVDAITRARANVVIEQRRRDAALSPPPLGGGAPTAQVEQVPALNTPEFAEYVRQRAAAGGMG